MKVFAVIFTAAVIVAAAAAAIHMNAEPQKEDPIITQLKINTLKLILKFTEGKTVTPAGCQIDIDRPDGVWKAACSRITLADKKQSFAVVGLKSASGLDMFNLSVEYPHEDFANITIDIKGKATPRIITAVADANGKKDKLTSFFNFNLLQSNFPKNHYTFVVEAPSKNQAQCMEKSYRITYDSALKRSFLNMASKFPC